MDAGSDLEIRLKMLELGLSAATSRLAELTTILSDLSGWRADERVELPAPVVVDADTLGPFAVGFYPREVGADNVPYRWTGKGESFELRLAMDRDIAWQFSMNIKSSRHSRLSVLRAMVDHMEVPIEISPDRSLISGTIPARPFSRVLCLSFFLPTFVPRQLYKDSSDSRTLGVMFFGVRFDPLPRARSESLGHANVPQHETAASDSDQ